MNLGEVVIMTIHTNKGGTTMAAVSASTTAGCGEGPTSKNSTGLPSARQARSAARSWRDEHGNVYSVEKTSKTGLWMVIRTNPGGHRKALKGLKGCGRRSEVQTTLDLHAEINGYAEVAQ